MCTRVLCPRVHKVIPADLNGRGSRPRSIQTIAKIDNMDVQLPEPGERIDYVVVGLLVIFGGVLFAYMSYSILHSR